jgi:2-polyprenyl-3-methyl-5-hydroxy-6-metoxy-1,4-benzoquinol methylase
MDQMNQDYRSRIYGKYVSLWRGQDSHFNEAEALRNGDWYGYYLRGLLPKNKNAAILDVGCGPGFFLYWLKVRGYTNLRGVDASIEQVEVAQRKIPNIMCQNAVEYLEAAKDSFDLITGFNVFEHFTKNEALKFLDASYGALRPGGRLILQLPNPASPMGGYIQFRDFTHEIGMTPNGLQDLLRVVGFTSYQAREHGPVPQTMTSYVRFALWQMIRFCLYIYDLIEIGGTPFPVYTRFFFASCVKPGGIGTNDRLTLEHISQDPVARGSEKSG